MKKLFDHAFPSFGFNPGITLPDEDGLYHVQLCVFKHMSDLGHYVDFEEGILDNLDGLLCNGYYPEDPTPEFYKNINELTSGYSIVTSELTTLDTGGILVTAKIKLNDTPQGDFMRERLESEGDVYFGAAGSGQCLAPDGINKHHMRLYKEIWSFDIAEVTPPEVH